MSKKLPSVLIVGFHDFWPLQMENGLRKRYGQKCKFQWRSWPVSVWDGFHFLIDLFRTDLLILTTMYLDFNSTAIRMVLFATRLLHKPVVKYWIGDDCLAICAQPNSGQTESVIPSFGKRLSHWAASDILSQKLLEVGIHARTVVMPSPERDAEEVPSFPPAFSIVGYWTDNRTESCGAHIVVEAAKRLPDIPFVILGATGKGLADCSDNISFVGAFDDTGLYMREAVIHIRHYEFDAVPGGTVEEAFYFGRYVIYTYEYPFADYVEYGDIDSLVAMIRAYKQKFDDGLLLPNLEAREFVEATWNPDARFEIMWHEILLQLQFAGDNN